MFFHVLLSMVIGDLDAGRVATLPLEADAVLIVKSLLRESRKRFNEFSFNGVCLRRRLGRRGD